MPSGQADYDPVSDDGYESKTCFGEEDFKSGIDFAAKLVGKLEVPRPTNRTEIVGAMRKIRYEFKARGVQKRRVILSVSMDGLSVHLRRRKSRIQWWRESKALLHQHPIQRVFYVSHDSQDLKVFSYIARDTSSNRFVCIVFKATNHAQAMRIVGTIGQAFEVCHKLHRTGSPSNTTTNRNSTAANSTKEEREEGRGRGGNTEREIDGYGIPSTDPDPIYVATTISSIDSQATQVPARSSSSVGNLRMIQEGSGTDPETEEGKTEMTLLSKRSLTPSHPLFKSPSFQSPLTSQSLQLARHQLEQQNQQTQVALSQVRFFKDKLAAETAARIEAQARVHHLLAHNRELLDHMNFLLTRIRYLETGDSNSSEVTMPPPISAPLATESVMATVPVFGRDCPSFSRVLTNAANSCPHGRELSTFRVPDPAPTAPPSSNSAPSIAKPRAIGSASPDSGHKEMSSDSLAQQLHRWVEAGGSSGAHEPSELSLPKIEPPPASKRRPGIGESAEERES